MPLQSIKFSICSVLLVSVFLSACVTGKRVPNLAVIFAQSKLQQGKRPVIIIPGILGSELQDPQTKETAWLNVSTIKGDNLSLPITPDIAKNRDTLVARRIIERAKVFRFVPEISIYQSLIDAMEKYGGYRAGDWENPRAEDFRDTYYVFAYDWRIDNVENARLLTQKINELKQKLNKPDLRFNVIAHSMGGLLARYAAMYGDANLPANGIKPAPDWRGAAHFNKIFMFGTPNEGSMSTLSVLLEGYRIGGFRIDSLNSEIAVTSPAVFQLLPHQNTARFFDENLQPIDVDLYNAETWKKYSWSAYANPAFLNKFAGQPNAVDKSGKKSEYADISLQELDAYFAAVLRRTKAFHDALDADTQVPPSVSFFAFGSDCDPTQDAVVLVQNKQTNRWQTLFRPKSFKNASGRAITKKAMEAVLYAPGDSSVTRRSLLAETLTQQNYRNSIFKASLPVTATFFCESHNQLPNSVIMQNNFLTALISEITQ